MDQSLSLTSFFTSKCRQYGHARKHCRRVQVRLFQDSEFTGFYALFQVHFILVSCASSGVARSYHSAGHARSHHRDSVIGVASRCEETHCKKRVTLYEETPCAKLVRFQPKVERHKVSRRRAYLGGDRLCPSGRHAVPAMQSCCTFPKAMKQSTK